MTEVDDVTPNRNCPKIVLTTIGDPYKYRHQKGKLHPGRSSIIMQDFTPIGRTAAEMSINFKTSTFWPFGEPLGLPPRTIYFQKAPVEVMVSLLTCNAATYRFRDIPCSVQRTKISDFGDPLVVPSPKGQKARPGHVCIILQKFTTIGRRDVRPRTGKK